MRFLTDKGELKSGRLVTPAEEFFIQAIEDGLMGGRYSVQTDKVRDFILEHFVLELKPFAAQTEDEEIQQP